MLIRRIAGPLGLALAGVLLAAAGQSGPSLTELLTRYEAGDYARVLESASVFDGTLQISRRFPQIADRWIAAGPDPRRRRLVAAAFLVEIARARYEMDATTWTEFAPSIEWMCHQFRRQTGPLPGEVAWHHAVVALAERVDDMWFLVPQEGRGKGADHLSHALSRFPDDSRLAFARVYAVMRTDRRDLNRRARTGPKPTLGGNRAYFRDKTLDAIAALRVYTSDPIVGAEAELRIAQMYFVVYDYDDAITHAAEASAKSRDAARRYQAAMLTGLAFERLSRFQEAGRAFAAALVIVPNGQSAALSLAPLLLLAGAQPQADAMVTASLAARPMADDDPWRLMQYGDYVRWPDIVADLRSALR